MLIQYISVTFSNKIKNGAKFCKYLNFFRFTFFNSKLKDVMLIIY